MSQWKDKQVDLALNRVQFVDVFTGESLVLGSSWISDLGWKVGACLILNVWLALS